MTDPEDHQETPARAKTPAPKTLGDFIDACGGTAIVASVSGRKPTWISKLRRTGKWRGARKVLQALSDEFGVEIRDEWLDEIEPRLDALKARRRREVAAARRADRRSKPKPRRAPAATVEGRPA